MIPIRDTIPRKNPPIATWFIILANSLVFLFELSMPEHTLVQFFYRFGLVPARYTHPAWALWIFGDNVEDRMGPMRFLFFYLSCGIAAGLVHWFTNPDSTIPAVGASGAIAGVMGAYLFLFPYARIIVLFPVLFIPFFFELPAVVYLGFWALAQLFSGTLALASPSEVGGVAWWGHVGGFGAGMLLQFFLVRRADAFRRPSRDEYGVENAWVPASYWRNNR